MYILITKRGGRYAGIDEMKESEDGFFVFEAHAKNGKIRKCKVAKDQVSELIEYDENPGDFAPQDEKS